MRSIFKSQHSTIFDNQKTSFEVTMMYCMHIITNGLILFVGYDFDAPIRTNIGYLAVPVLTEGGFCSFTSVRFQTDRESSCEHEASAQSCSQPSFNAMNFLLPTGSNLPACNVPEVLSGVTSNSLALKTVEYYCLSTASDYLRFLTNSTATDSDIESLFQSSGSAKAVSRCAFDDSKTRPNLPSIDNASGTCQNAVLDVNYELLWNGRQVNRITAKVTIGNFPVNPVTKTTVTYTYFTQIVVNATQIMASSFVTRSLSSTIRPAVSNTLLSSFRPAGNSSIKRGKILASGWQLPSLHLAFSFDFLCCSTRFLRSCGTQGTCQYKQSPKNSSSFLQPSSKNL